LKIYRVLSWKTYFRNQY